MWNRQTVQAGPDALNGAPLTMKRAHAAISDLPSALFDRRQTASSTTVVTDVRSNQRRFASAASCQYQSIRKLYNQQQ